MAESRNQEPLQHIGNDEPEAEPIAVNPEVENRVGESKKDPFTLKPGFPSKTPLKGTIISAKCEYISRQKKQDFCVPPHVICFKHGNQFDPEVAIVTAGPPKDYHKQIAGISVSGILSPKNAMEFEESDGRFALVFAGQARLLGRKTHLKDKSTSNFKMLDEVWVDPFESPIAEEDEVAPICHMEYNDDTMYKSPTFYDEKKHGDCLKVGIVVGVSAGTDLFTVELIPCECESESEHEDSDDGGRKRAFVSKVSGGLGESSLSRKTYDDIGDVIPETSVEYSNFFGDKTPSQVWQLLKKKGDLPKTAEGISALGREYETFNFQTKRNAP